jgi:hypothetical protein
MQHVGSCCACVPGHGSACERAERGLQQDGVGIERAPTVRRSVRSRRALLACVAVDQRRDDQPHTRCRPRRRVSGGLNCDVACARTHTHACAKYAAL